MYREDIELIKTSTGRIMNVYPVEDPAFLEIRVKVLTTSRVNYRIICDEERNAKQLVLEREYETYSSGECVLINFCINSLDWFRKLDPKNAANLKKVVIEFLNNLPF